MTEPTPSGKPEASPDTAGRTYADRLQRLSGARWKQVLNVQAPFRANIRSLKLGKTLDVGSGVGRNLHHLETGSVGVDHNPFSVEVAREAGLVSYTSDEFFADPDLSAPASYDSMLSAHVVEHLEPEDARSVMASYLPSIRPGGAVVWITPQERGFASDETHVQFADFAYLTLLAHDLGLSPVRHYSFPFPRFVGRAFTYNEFVFVARTPG